MSEARKIAVLLAYHGSNAATYPTLQDCKDLMVAHKYSLQRYWRQNTADWFDLTFDYFGPFTISLPPAPDSRYTSLNKTKEAAGQAGIDLSHYDNLIVFLAPGTDNIKGYDAGTTGVGKGCAAVLVSFENHTFFCHEMGHLLGFDHSYGILNTGSDWTDDHIDQFAPVYGDPYDLMSSATFGGAAPTTSLNLPFNGFPNAAAEAGPMLSRAQLHFYKPLALELSQKVRHVYEDGDNLIVPIHPAGGGNETNPELLVYHPHNENSNALGRIYVEYRQQFDLMPNTIWDSGLEATGEARDHAGIIVHTVKNIPGTNKTAVWYAGRICLPTPDSDIAVNTALGSMLVAVSEDQMAKSTPPFVRVRVTRRGKSRVIIRVDQKDVETVTLLEKRPIPGWDWAGTFSWEKKATVRTAIYSPVLNGLGGESPNDALRSVNVTWFLGNHGIYDDHGIADVYLPSLEKTVHIHYAVDQASCVLTLHNDPADDAYSIPVQARAYEKINPSQTFSAESIYEVDGLSEGWGADYHDFLDFWNHITHPVPIPKFKPPKPEDYRIALDRLHRKYQQLQVSNPSVADQLHHMVVDQERVFRHLMIR